MKIYYFTGTGNSLYAARQLASRFQNVDIVSMAGAAPEEEIGGEGEQIGFVFPSYYGDLPRIVREYITRLDICKDSYIFALVTMGGAGQGTVKALSELLAQKGLKLSYGRGVRMNANYILKYDPGKMARLAKSQKSIGKAIAKIAGEIEGRRELLKTSNISAEYLYKEGEKLDEAFFTEDSCDACGICEKICPVENIKIINGRPEWQHHCEHCVACISWCPKQAIQYGEKTKKRESYRNSHVSLKDMFDGVTAR